MYKQEYIQSLTDSASFISQYTHRRTVGGYHGSIKLCMRYIENVLKLLSLFRHQKRFQLSLLIKQFLPSLYRSYLKLSRQSLLLALCCSRMPPQTRAQQKKSQSSSSSSSSSSRSFSSSATTMRSCFDFFRHHHHQCCTTMTSTTTLTRLLLHHHHHQ